MLPFDAAATMSLFPAFGDHDVVQLVELPEVQEEAFTKAGLELLDVMV